MLSMRMQGMLHSPVKSSFNLADDTGKPEQDGLTEETATTPLPELALTAIVCLRSTHKLALTAQSKAEQGST
jgi:hypothetical protein